MAARTAELNAEYAQALAAFVQRRDEEALMKASTLGRLALASGLGVLDIVQCHHAALAAILGDGAATDPSHPAALEGSPLEASATFLCESLATFEMAQRGFQEISSSVVKMVEFNAVVVHELRTPLTSIVTSLGLLEEIADGTIGSATSRLLANMRAGAEILRARTNDLQDLVGFQSGVLRLRPRLVDPGQVLRACAQRMEPEFERAGVLLRLQIPAGVPRVMADPDRIDQVVSNLLQNALKYGAAGGAVDLRLSGTSEAVRIEVQDYGKGVSAWDRARVFQPHVRGSDVRPGIPGMGIGLALASELARQHRGTLTLESEENRGSTFRLELPAEGATGAPTDAAAGVPERGTP